MKVLFDTSVLVSALVRPHALHARACPWLDRARAGEFTFLVSSHSTAELYSILTTCPVRPRISPAEARQLIRENIEGAAEIVTLSAADYAMTLNRLASWGLSGGVVYDAMIARAAQKAGVDRLLTFDVDDFRRVWPEGKDRISAP
jgi:predicted nucleic acid-binding protein